MTESYILLRQGRISLLEQAYMSAEDRAWWIKRIDKEAKEQSQAR